MAGKNRSPISASCRSRSNAATDLQERKRRRERSRRLFSLPRRIDAAGTLRRHGGAFSTSLRGALATKPRKSRSSGGMTIDVVTQRTAYRFEITSSTNSVINVLILRASTRRVAKPLAVFAAGSITRHPRWMSDDRSIFDLNTDAGTYRRLVSRRPSSVRSPCPSCRSQAQCAGDLSLHPR